ncbi:pyruvate ferredoxin oxidoreductase [archaeon CG_4_8_14_3_um_filter_38_5]|nr:MAG: pyruvate ferredoxin oxidoreductase [archaeon CG07_land_8_20_14_0_80_38_8]PIU89281.1 MAG: pyruvate ferredoxin oxidoreductase [archaeon CG06_land_8_20_14_3_00_37_11]PIX44812.1 MAG: pyruvate ferredoxin oxidoreductase [archaeon CG_4_8_14_3_um_filter_38_5]
MNFKELAMASNKLASGHRSCAGCGFPSIVRTVMKATKKQIIVSCATGCLEVTTTIYPYTSWLTPFIHNAFENASATISGVEAAYKALKKKGKLRKDVKFLAIGGDGGTYDIGLQSLSGALERGQNFVYLCYDNEAYMNTGVQRSSATPRGANTTTTPAGKASFGKLEWKKELMQIAIAHGINYAAQASPHNLIDLYNKAEKAFNTKGPSILVVLSPCPLGWKSNTNMSVQIAKLAAETNFWPLYEYENGKYVLNYEPAKRKPIIEFFKTQGRFKHLLKNKKLLEEIQGKVDEKWSKLKKLCEEK